MTRSWFNGKTGDLEHVEAERLFASFVAAESDSLHQLEALTGVASDSPLMTIDSQVSEAARRWDEDDPDISLPIWYGDVETEMGLGSVGASIYDGLIYRVGKELNQALGSEWIVVTGVRSMHMEDFPDSFYILGNGFAAEPSAAALSLVTASLRSIHKSLTSDCHTPHVRSWHGKVGDRNDN